MMTSISAIRRKAELRRDPDLPYIDGPSVAVGGLTSAGLYLVLTAWLLPGVIEIVAALPVGARIGVLLLTSTVTRFVGGWFAARRYRTRHGLPRRAVALSSAALGGLAGYVGIVVLALLAGAEVSLGDAMLDTVRWPLESAVGALIALPGTVQSTRRTI